MSRPPVWLRALLRLLPEPFRSTYSDDIAEAVSELESEAAPLHRIGLYGRVSLDVLRVAGSIRFGGLLSGSWSQDLRFAGRSLRRDLGLSTFAVLIVGLGIGASVSVFSVVDALLIRPLPFADPDRLVLVSNGPIGPERALSSHSVQVIHLMDIREQASTLEDVAGYHLFDREGDHVLMGTAGPERLTRLRVTPNFFDVLGVSPALGRTFNAEESADGGPQAILLTHATWSGRFGADPGILGRTLPLDGASATVIGVLPESFDFESIFSPREGVDYVAPFPITLESSRSGNTLALVGRLAPGASVEQTLQETQALAERMKAVRTEVPNINGFQPFVTPLRTHVSGGYRAAVLVLAGAVGLVMLLVCANLSNLLLARGATRQQELAIRTAMGARRGRLVRQMVVESLVLSLAGAGLGIVLAVALTSWLSGLPVGVALLDSVRMDGGALGFAVLAALVTGLGFGIAPAWRSSDVELGSVLKEGARGSSSGRRARALQDLLVVSQVALACVLLVGATLLSRSLTRLVRVDLGYEPQGAVTLRIDPTGRFASEDERGLFVAEALRRARDVAGVESAALTDVLPMHFNRRWSIRTAEAEPGGDEVSPYVRNVSEDFVETMGLTLLSGRDFERSDDRESTRVAMVNTRLAERLWPGEDPIGRSVSIGTYEGRVEWEVVGVVRGTRFISPELEPSTEIFLPIRQLGDHNAIHLVARGSGGVDDLPDALAAGLAGLHPELATRDFESIDSIVGETLAPKKLLVGLLTAFALFAIVLSALGIYAVIAYSVGRRRRELGIRIALGASANLLQGQVVRETGARVAVGVVVGLLGAGLTSRLLEGLLFGVTPLDPITYGVTAVGLVAVAVAASWIPARKATRFDPMDALAAEGRS